VPLPFCRIRVIAGRPIQLAPREPLKPRLVELQRELDAIS
jgi:hypothetical protein